MAEIYRQTNYAVAIGDGQVPTSIVSVTSSALAVTIMSGAVGIGAVAAITSGINVTQVGGNVVTGVSGGAIAVSIISGAVGIGAVAAITSGVNVTQVGGVVVTGVSGGAIAVSIISGSAGSSTSSSSNVNVVQIAGGAVPVGLDNADGSAVVATGLMPSQNFNYVFNGTTWDRARSVATWNGQATLQSGTPFVITAIYNPAIDPTAYGLSPIDNQTDNPNLVNTRGVQIAAITRMFNAGSGNYERQRIALGTTGIPSVNTEGTRSTYSAAIANAAFSAASGTDVFLINGSATNVVRVLAASVSFTATLPVGMHMAWTRRSAVTTAGTSTHPLMVVHDTSNAAASAVVTAYTNTAGQAPGTPLGTVRSAALAATLASVGADEPWVIDFTTRNGQGMTLRGPTDVFALTMGSGNSTATTSNISVYIEWSESAA